MSAYSFQNSWIFPGFSLRNQHFAFVDTSDYLADGLFIRHKVPVRFLREYQKPGSPYVVLFCRCRKKDAGSAAAALDELRDKMLLCGYTDYPQFCRQLADIIVGGQTPTRKTRKKGGGQDGTVCPIGKAE